VLPDAQAPHGCERVQEMCVSVADHGTVRHADVAGFTIACIRDYVPFLVEHIARNELSRRATR